jgi:glycosyltransferase involved in cell wall biosynthesis
MSATTTPESQIGQGPSTARGKVAPQRLLVVTPTHNEADHIERVVGAVAAQTRPPDEWIVVDDNSTDGTGEMLRALAGRLPFMRVVAGERAEALESTRDRLALAAAPRAFNAGLGAASEEFTHVAKLDGDVELPPL